MLFKPLKQYEYEEGMVDKLPGNGLHIGRLLHRGYFSPEAMAISAEINFRQGQERLLAVTAFETLVDVVEVSEEAGQYHAVTEGETYVLDEEGDVVNLLRQPPRGSLRTREFTNGFKRGYFVDGVVYARQLRVLFEGAMKEVREVPELVDEVEKIMTDFESAFADAADADRLLAVLRGEQTSEERR